MRSFGAIVGLALLCASCRHGASSTTDGGSSPSFMSTLAGLVGFEGEIEMVTTSSYTPSGSTTKMLFMIKKDKLRIEMPALTSLGMIFLIDSGKKKMWWLTTSTKTYMEMPMGTPAASPTPSTPAKSTATKTGKTDKVAGYSCDEWQVIDTVSHVKTLACMTSGLTFLGLGASPLKDLGGGSWMDAVGSGFPLRAEMFDASGSLMTKMEATRIDKKSEPDALFEIPPGYTDTGSPVPLTVPPPKATTTPSPAWRR